MSTVPFRMRGFPSKSTALNIQSWLMPASMQGEVGLSR